MVPHGWNDPEISTNRRTIPAARAQSVAPHLTPWKRGPGRLAAGIGRMELSRSSRLDYLRTSANSLQGRDMRARPVLLSAWFIAAIALVACSGSAMPTIDGAWARPGADGAQTAAYFTVKGA